MDCVICDKPLDYEPEYCCDGHDCGCRGLPIYPPVCSNACSDACLENIGKPMEERRLIAGIEKYTA